MFFAISGKSHYTALSLADFAETGQPRLISVNQFHIGVDFWAYFPIY